MGYPDLANGEKGTIIDEYETESSDGREETKTARGLSRNAGPVALDVAIALAAGYFVIFAALAAHWDGTPVTEYKTEALLEAAKYGPTIWPILFALIAARLVTAVARWRLENGATIGFLEYSLGSRSMSAAFMAPVRFRTINLFVPLLLALWAFSPAGGQASLRIVTAVDKFTSKASKFLYLDFTVAIFPFDDMTETFQIIYTDLVFNSAIMTPPSLREASQDQYGNLRIPMLEPLASKQIATADGWYDTSTKNDLVYISLIGTPIAGIRNNVNSSFNIETGYMYFDCRVVPKVPVEGNFRSVVGNVNYSSVGVKNFGIHYADGPDYHHGRDATLPRIVTVESFVGAKQGGPVISEASCAVIQTYVEAQVSCNTTRSCDVQAVRASKKEYPDFIHTALDGHIPNAPTVGNVSYYFFEAFISANLPTTNAWDGEIMCSNSFENYLAGVTFPIYPRSCKWHMLYEVGNTLFSERFTQLINTYWLAAVDSTGVTGDFNPGSIREEFVTVPAEGNVQSVDTVMRCHMTYLAHLLFSSLVLFIAGMLTAALDARRRGPDVLDDFVNQLRHNPYVKVNHGSSMDDGAEKSKRLRQTVVKMGDVKPNDRVGYVAIATPTPEQPVAPLKLTRHYS